MTWRTKSKEIHPLSRSFARLSPKRWGTLKHFCSVDVGTGKRGHYERGLFTGGISKISRISRKLSDSPLFSTVWGFSIISRFSRNSRKWTFLKRPLVRTRRWPEAFTRKERHSAQNPVWVFSLNCLKT